MRGPQQGSLIGLTGRHLGDDLASEQDNRPVADKSNLGKLGRKQEHGRPGVGHLSQQPIDLMFGPDIDAARRIETKQGLKSRGDPPCDNHLLLIATAQSTELRSSAGVNLQPLDGGADALTLALAANEAPI